MNRSAVLAGFSGLLIVAPVVFAQPRMPPKLVDMAELQVGNPFPYAAFNAEARDTMADQLGFYTFDAPNLTQSPFPFAHFQVAINNRTRVIYYLRGARSYPALSDCLSALKSVADFSRSRYGFPAKDSKQGYFDGVSGDVMVDAGCAYVGLSPYIQLTVTITSVSQKKELDEMRKKRYAR